MSHRCEYVKDGKQCDFYLPDSYPFPLCPWHFTGDEDSGNKLATVALGVAVLAGAALVAKVLPSVLKRINKKQEQIQTTPSKTELQGSHTLPEPTPDVIDFQEFIRRRQTHTEEKMSVGDD